MIGENLKRALAQAQGHEPPVLSLYLDVNPANPDNVNKAFVLRAAQAMREIGLAKEYIGNITGRIEKDHVIARGRSLVIFAGEDPDEFFEGHDLQTRLPLLGRSDGALAHWGEPFGAPLLYVLDQKQKYAVIHVSVDRVRVFEAFLGQIVELSSYYREADTDSWRSQRHARRSPGIGLGVAARGGADVDRFQDRLDEATARLYRDLSPDLERTLDEEGIERIIISGTPASIAPFKETLSTKLSGQLVADIQPPTNPDGAADEWLPLVSDLIARIEEEHESELLEEVREAGVTGLHDSLTLLQEHRLHTVVVPWILEASVFRAEDGRVATGRQEAGVLSPGQNVTEVRLLEVLPGLAEQSGARLEFVAGEAETRLREEFGGLAGLKRY